MSDEPYLDIVSIGLLSVILSALRGAAVTAIVAPFWTAFVENERFFKLEALVLLEGILLLLLLML